MAFTDDAKSRIAIPKMLPIGFRKIDDAVFGPNIVNKIPYVGNRDVLQSFGQQKNSGHFDHERMMSL
jgi:hypothetical protein